VVLFPDTFTDFFHPEVGVAAVEVLEAAGYAVDLPARRLCCGRPLYDQGMLDRARSYLHRDLAALDPAVRAGTPIVFLEPSCAAVFRDELPDLLAGDPRARRLAGATKILSELVDADPSFPVGRLDRRALVQVHCHQHAVLGDEAEKRVLERLGLAAEDPDAGCCGMAGSFGFEAGERHAVSVAVGERALLPRIRAEPRTTLLLADGFSCRTQIAQRTGRRALHLAEALRLAQEPAPATDAERWVRRRRLRAPAGLLLARGLALAFAAGFAAAAVRALRRR
jgi:Fe-S oxidoreductase